MNLIEEAKRRNRTLRLTFPDGKRIPFRLLTWERYSAYWELLLKGHVVPAIIEQEIFNECVLDYDYIANSGNLRAGIVGTIAAVILQMSGPNNPSLFNAAIDSCRQHIDTIDSQIVMVICRAFPAYKPEDIEQMTWNKVLFRLAQAERILMSKNPPELAEPIRVLSPEEIKESQRKKSGKIRVEDLVREGRDLAKEENRRPPIGRLDKDDSGQLTPKQKAQLEALAKVKKRLK